MFVIKDSQVRSRGSRLLAEASDLGLKPSEWPAVIAVAGSVFYRRHPVVARGDLLAYNYSTDEGKELVIVND